MSIGPNGPVPVIVGRVFTGSGISIPLLSAIPRPRPCTGFRCARLQRRLLHGSFIPRAFLPGVMTNASVGSDVPECFSLAVRCLSRSLPRRLFVHVILIEAKDSVRFAK